MPDADISEGHWLINVAGIPGTFQTKTGGEVGVEHTKDFDGGSLSPNVFQGKPAVSDLTVGRGYRSPRDGTIAKALRARLASGSRFSAIVTCQALSEQMVPIGEADIYDCVLQKVSPQEANANSAQPSRLELVFTAKSVR
jgi:hypothetical protein